MSEPIDLDKAFMSMYPLTIGGKEGQRFCQEFAAIEKELVEHRKHEQAEERLQDMLDERDTELRELRVSVDLARIGVVNNLVADVGELDALRKVLEAARMWADRPGAMGRTLVEAIAEYDALKGET